MPTDVSNSGADDAPHHALGEHTLVDSQNETLQLILSGAPLPKIFARLVTALETEIDGLGSILLLDTLTLELRHGAAPSLPPAFTRAIDGLRIGPGAGTCGAAAFDNRIVVTEDIGSDPGWRPLRELALSLGLVAAYSVPITSSSGGVLGTFAVYLKTQRKPTLAELEMVSLLCRTVSIAIERRRSEEHLQNATLTSLRERRLYETVLSNTPDLIYVFNLEHRFTYANEALLKLWGRTWEDSIGKSCLELGYEPWHAAMHDREIETVIATKQPIRGDVAFEGTNGRRLFDYIFSPVFGASGEVEAIAGTTRDVTEHRRTGANTRFLADLAQELAPLSDEATLIRHTVSAVGRHLNAHRCYFIECSVEENSFIVSDNWVRDGDANLAGRLTISDFGGPEWWAKYSAGNFAVSDALNDPVIAPDKVGSYVSVGVRSFAVQPFKQKTPWTVVLAVTEKIPRVWKPEEMELLENVAARVWPLVERVRSEVALRTARDEALAASRAKDDFLAVLSHELRTPLNPVLLIASEAAANPALPSQVRADFDTVARNVALEARLIDDLLDLTRITHNKMALQLGAQNIHDLLLQVRDAAQPEFKQRNLTLETHLEAPRHRVQGDEVRLQQIFWNLLKNAAKFTPQGGKISLSSAIRPERPGILEIKVADSGIGLSPEEVAGIFTPFVQGEHSRSGAASPFGGLGLGLAIARRLAELHHGTIRVASAGRGLGATFVVELPLLSVAAERVAPLPPAEPSVAVSRQSCRRILLIEDHLPSRQALRRLLLTRKIEVVEAGSVAEALEKAETTPVDLVISDLGLPDGTGYDLMKELKSRYGARGIALSGYGTDSDIARSHESGFLAHLTKPVQVQQLDRVIAQFGALT